MEASHAGGAQEEPQRPANSVPHDRVRPYMVIDEDEMTFVRIKEHRPERRPR